MLTLFLQYKQSKAALGPWPSVQFFRYYKSHREAISRTPSRPRRWESEQKGTLVRVLSAIYDGCTGGAACRQDVRICERRWKGRKQTLKPERLFPCLLLCTSFRHSDNVLYEPTSIFF